MDYHTLRIISDKMVASLPSDFVDQYHDYSYIFKHLSLSDWAYSELHSIYDKGDFSYDHTYRKYTSFVKSCRAARKTFLAPKRLKMDIPFDNTVVKNWFFTSENGPGNFIHYPYFEYITDAKKKNFFSYDFLNLFYNAMKNIRFKIDDFFTYFPESMVNLPIFGANQNSKGEKIEKIELDGTTLVVHDMFTNNDMIYKNIRTENARALGPDHNIVYFLLIGKYISKYIFSSSSSDESILGGPKDYIRTNTSEISAALKLSPKYTMEYKNKIVGQLLSDLTLNTYARFNAEGSYATDTLRLIGDITTYPMTDVSLGNEYDIIFPQNLLIQQFANQSLMVTSNEELDLLEDSSRILVPFLQKERIDLFDKKQTQKSYDILSFKNYIRIPRKGVKSVLNVVVPILENCKANHLFINDFEVLDIKASTIVIDYIPLTESERQNILLRIGAE